MALTMRRRDRGAVAVEMAIILPLLLLVVGGIVDFGRLLFTQNIVTNAAREGPRARALGYTIAQADARVDDAMLGAGTHNVTHRLRTASTVTANADCPSSPVVTDRTEVTVTVTNFSFIFPIPATPPQPSAQSQMRCGG